MSVWKHNFKLKAERGVAVRGWRRVAVKKHRAMPYAIWPHRAYGSGWTPGISCALWWSIGDAAFHHKTFRLYPVFLTPPLCLDFWPPHHSLLVVAIHGHRQWCEIIDYAWPGLDCAIISFTIILFRGSNTIDNTDGCRVYMLFRAVISGVPFSIIVSQ